MNNRYIAMLRSQKNIGLHGLNEYVIAISDVLENLLQEKEALLHNNENNIVAFKPWLGFLKQPFQPKVTEKNIAIVKDILREIKDILAGRKEEPVHLDFKQLLILITPKIELLSKNGETRQLLEFIANDIKHISLNKNDDIVLTQDDAFKDRLINVLARKNLSLNCFNAGNKKQIQLEDMIEKHAAWAFKNIYQVAYPTPTDRIQAIFFNINKKSDTIARYYHGIEHVARAATFIPVFANLYRKYGDADALKLTNEEIKLLQIAVLFHDAAREDEEEDKWDHESALFLFYYLTNVLSIDAFKAKELAEAVANKDIKETGYYILQKREDGEVVWQIQDVETRELLLGEKLEKNIYQKLIHDADCLDIIRARDHFDASYLDFYKDFSEKMPQAMEELAVLISEAKNLIARGGDSRIGTSPATKEKYENEAAYFNIENDICNPAYQYKILRAYYGNNTLLPLDALNEIDLIEKHAPYDPTKPLTAENAKSALLCGKILARGIATPSTFPGEKWQGSKNKSESLATLELRKTLRRKGIPTNSSKDNRNEKHGNLARSTAMIGYGAGLYCNAGYLIINPDLDAMRQLSHQDLDSGRGKKQHLYGEKTKVAENDIESFFRKFKLGAAGGLGASHTEILYDTTDFQAIYFTNDLTLFNFKPYVTYYGAEITLHKDINLVQAIYLQQEYKKMDPQKRTLPIFEYTSTRNDLVYTADLSDAEIINMWTAVCGHFINECLDNNIIDAAIMPVERLKAVSVYGFDSLDLHVLGTIVAAPADLNYPQALQVKISNAILNERARIIKQRATENIQALNNKKISINDEKCFSIFYAYPAAIQNIPTKILDNVFKKLCSINIKEFLTNYKLLFADANHTEVMHNVLEAAVKWPVFRAYFYASQLNLENVTLQIQNELKEKIKESTSYVNCHSLHWLFGLVDIFNLGGDFKKLLCQEIETNLLIMMAEKRLLNDIMITFIQLKKSGLLSKETQSAIAQHFHDNANKYDLRDINPLLSLSSLFDKDEMYPFVINFTKNKSFDDVDLLGHAEFRRTYPHLAPYLNNIEVFQVVLKNVVTQTQMRSISFDLFYPDENYHQPLQCFYAFMYVLQDLIKHHKHITYTDQHREIIFQNINAYDPCDFDINIKTVSLLIKLAKIFEGLCFDMPETLREKISQRLECLDAGDDEKTQADLQEAKALFSPIALKQEDHLPRFKI